MRKPKAVNEFGERLRILRLQKNLSQKDVARLASVHHMHYGRYERGLTVPTAEVLRRLADKLGVTTDYLLQGNHDQAAKANFEDRDLLALFQEVQGFPENQKMVVKKTLEAFVVQRRVEAAITK